MLNKMSRIGNILIVLGAILLIVQVVVPMQIKQAGDVVSLSPFDGAEYENLGEVVAITQKLTDRWRFSKITYQQGTSVSVNLAPSPQTNKTIRWSSILPNPPLGSHSFTYIFWGIPLGDIDGDNIINSTDHALMNASWYSEPGDINWNPDADLNEDGIVNLADLAILAKNIGLESEPEVLGAIEGTFSIVSSPTPVPPQPSQPKPVSVPWQQTSGAFFGNNYITITAVALMASGATLHYVYRRRKPEQ